MESSATTTALGATKRGLAFSRALGAAEGVGPCGIAIASAAAKVRMIRDASNAVHQDEDKIAICLNGAGVKSEAVAELLSKKTDLSNSFYPGQSQLVFLSNFARSRDLDVVDFINSFTLEKSKRLSARVIMELKNGQDNPSRYRTPPVTPDVRAQDEADAMEEFERQLIFDRLIAYEPVLPGQAGH